MTALDFAAVMREGLCGLEGGRVQRAWALGDSIALRLRVAGADKVIVLSPRLGVYESAYELPRTQPPARLADALRWMRGARLVALRQVAMDRVAGLTLERRGHRRELIVEWVREGNIVVAGGDGLIEACLRVRRLRDRSIAPGEVYTPPPARGLDPLTLNPLDAGRLPPAKPGMTASAHLSRLVNAPGEVLAEALHRSGVDPGSPASSVEPEILAKALLTVREIYARVLEGGAEPHVAVVEGQVVAAYPFRPASLGVEVARVDSLTRAFDELYTPMLLPRAEEGGPGGLVEDRARQFMERAGALRKLAEEVFSNAQTYQALIEEFLELRRRARWDELGRLLAEKYPMVVGVDPASLKITVRVDGVEAVLDAAASAAANASRLYAEAKELERKARRALEIAGSLSPGRGGAEPPLRRIRSRSWYEGFWHFTSSEGFLVLGGKDASQNEALVRKHLGEHDIFMHADVYGGPAVVIKTEGRAVGGQTLLEAAQLAAAYSRAWESGLASVDVYWVPARQVSKKPPSGEYLPRGAFMVYGERNWLRGVKLELAVGVRVLGDGYELVSGPPSALKGRCDAMVVLEPGRVSREEAARKVSGLLSAALDGKVKIPAHEVLSRLPRGGFHVSRVVR